MNEIAIPPNFDVSGFPKDDITTDVANYIAVMLQNKSMFERMHKFSDSDNYLYHAAHTVLMNRGEQELEIAAQAKALILGVMFFEVVGGLVRRVNYPDKIVKQSVAALGKDLRTTSFNYVYEEGEKQREEMPELAAIIEETSVFYLSDQTLSAYALGGSAMIRLAQLKSDKLLRAS